MKPLPDILPEPRKPSNLPGDAKWLAGEGAGSWFVIHRSHGISMYFVQRFSPEGKLECDGLFNASRSIDFTTKFNITYPSHCQKITLIQGAKDITLTRIEG